MNECVPGDELNKEITLSDGPDDFRHLVNITHHQCQYTYPKGAVDRLSINSTTIYLPASLQAAVPKRQTEFLLGRYCSFMAAQKLGVFLPALAIRADRSPDWPQSLVGSITHAQGCAAALMASTAHYMGLGIDKEWQIDTASNSAILSQVISAKEKHLIPGNYGMEMMLTIFFSAKEALYKAIQPTVQRIVDFKEVYCCEMGDGYLVFRCEPRLAQELMPIKDIRVGFKIEDRLITSWCVLAAG